MNNAPSTPHPAAAFAVRLGGILRAVSDLIFDRQHILGDLSRIVFNRISAANVRLVALFTALAAGRVPMPRAPRPGRNSGKPVPYLPRRRAWLVETFGYHAAGYASQLQYLLDDPETRATLAAAPPAALAAAGRNLRPLCRLLGVTLPPLLQLPPRPVQVPAPPPRPKPPRPAPEPLPKLRPLYPRRFAREMPILFPTRKNTPA